eukprot:95922-Hanusia_phi.AAC.1
MLVYIKWRANLEPIYCHETDDVKEVRRRIMTMSNVPVEHKLLVHHGLLLRDGMTLINVSGSCRGGGGADMAAVRGY